MKKVLSFMIAFAFLLIASPAAAEIREGEISTTPDASLVSVSHISGPKRIILRWTTSGTPDVVRVVAGFSCDNDLTPDANHTLIWDASVGAGSTVTHSNLQSGTNICYTLGVRDSQGRWSIPIKYVAKPWVGTKLIICCTTTLPYGTATTLAGELKTRIGVAVPSSKVQIQTYSSGKWVNYGTPVTTNSAGVYRKAIVVKKKASWRAIFLGRSAGPADGFYTSTSPMVSLRYSAKVTATLSISGKVAKVSVTVAPNMKGKKILLKKYTGGNWKVIKTGYLNSYSKITFQFPLSRGEWKVEFPGPPWGEAFLPGLT